MFTRNRVFAAPVKVSRENVADGQIRAVLYNAGNANACNGLQGEKDARESVSHLAQNLGLEDSDIGVCSTGLIGELLPMDKLNTGIDQLTAEGALGDNGAAAAKAIMTTDTVDKETVVFADGWTVGGMGKGEVGGKRS